MMKASPDTRTEAESGLPSEAGDSIETGDNCLLLDSSLASTATPNTPHTSPVH